MKIKASQFKILVKEIVGETLQQLNESERGEWWIYPGGSAQYADGDVGDSGHEGYVIEYVVHEIYEHFLGEPPDPMGYLSQYEEELKDAVDMDENDLEVWERGGGPTEVITKKLLEDGVYKDKNQASDAVFIAWGSNSKDARDYAMKYLGWKRMTTSGYGTSIQSWFLRQSDLDDIKRGIFDAWNDNGENEEEDAEHSVEIELMSTNRYFSDIPLNVLEKASVRDVVPYLKRSMMMRESQHYDQIGHNKKKT